MPLIHIKNMVFIDPLDIVAVVGCNQVDDKTLNNASKWYDEKDQKPRSLVTLKSRDRDIILSASPKTILEKVEKRLGISGGTVKETGAGEDDTSD